MGAIANLLGIVRDRTVMGWNRALTRSSLTSPCNAGAGGGIPCAQNPGGSASGGGGFAATGGDNTAADDGQ
jgi:hypothetical protein